MTDLNAQIINEILIQARESFTLAKHNYRIALTATSASILVSLIGIGVFASGRATQGAIATATGALPLIACAQYLKSAGDQLDAASKQLNETLDNIDA